MAFSPFNIFRRNQKAIFAVITVFIMFTFVLSSGLGGGADFFDWFPRWLGGAGKRGPDLCKIDGQTIYERDIRETRFNRVMANRFMMYASQQTSAVLRRDAQEKLVEATPMLGNPARDILEGKNNPTFMIMAQMMAGTPNARPQDRNLVAVVQTWMELEGHRKLAEMAGGTYFTNAPNKTARDVVDFMLWEKKADRLGIAYTHDDVKKLVRQEFFDQFKSDVEIREAMSRDYSGRFTLDAVLTGLASEFKVRAAQTALLGATSESKDRTATYPPIFNTPYDLYSFFKDKTSPTAYQALAVPAASFATQVKAEPTEPEVQRLFNERKDYEPDPQREEYGFKEPRKLKVEWVAASGEEPYYKKAAADWIARTEQFAKAGIGTLTVPVPGIGPAGWVGTAVAPMTATEPLVQTAYKGLVDVHERDLAFRWGVGNAFLTPSQLLSSSFAPWAKRAARTKDDIDKKRPVYAAGPELAAQLTGLGAAGINGSALLQPAAFYAQAAGHETRERGAAGALLFLAASPGPGLLERVAAGEAAYRRSLPKPLPIDAVRTELLSELADRKARELAAADLFRLQAELTRLGEKGKARDKGAAARDFAAAFIKERGLKTGATPDGVSEWTVRDDAALAPLRDAGPKGFGADQQDGPFGARFFATFDPQRGTKITASGLYLPEFYPAAVARTVTGRAAQVRELKAREAKALGRPVPSDEQLDKEVAKALSADLAAGNRDAVFLAWRTDDQPAKSLKLTDARPRVVEAWRRTKARDEARQAAEQIAARIKAAPGSAPAQFVPVMYDLQTELQAKFADQKAKDGVRLFKLDNVAPIQILSEATGMARPFSLAGSTEIAYPSADMAKKLLDERNGPTKTVFVVPDAPKDTYYVFALTGKQERGIEEFRTSVYSPTGRGQIRELIYAGHASESVVRMKDSVMTLLRKEFNYEETDAQKAKLDDRDKKGED